MRRIVIRIATAWLIALILCLALSLVCAAALYGTDQALPGEVRTLAISLSLLVSMPLTYPVHRSLTPPT